MKPLFLFTFILYVGPFSSFAQEAKTPAPSVIASRFYDAYIRLKVRGLPDEKQAKVIDPLFAPEVRKLLDAARAGQQRYIRENKDEKPPWIEGSLFSSLFEGLDSYKLGTPVPDETKASIPVALSYKDGDKTIRWIDVIILEKSPSGWLVSDIFLNGPWDFKSGYSLRQVLSTKE
jgi:hypothetical protein